MDSKLSKAARRAVWGWTALMLMVLTPLSMIAMTTIIMVVSGTFSAAGLAASIAVPLLIGGPAIVLTAMKFNRLLLANEHLHVLASTDELTAILNRRAFTSLVASYLAGGPPVQQVPEGAFLVIDADEFKRINDSHGHDWGDDALQKIAASIKSSIREHDLVGRIGGEEFGVLLAGADLATAGSVAERIRKAVDAIDFQPGGAEHRLSVSVGGASFGGTVAFADLYRVADQRLYEAKQAGRNCVAVTAMMGEGAARAA